jgi:hypothetical protein
MPLPLKTSRKRSCAILRAHRLAPAEVNGDSASVGRARAANGKRKGSGVATAFLNLNEYGLEI